MMRVKAIVLVLVTACLAVFSLGQEVVTFGDKSTAKFHLHIQACK